MKKIALPIFLFFTNLCATTQEKFDFDDYFVKVIDLDASVKQICSDQKSESCAQLVKDIQGLAADCAAIKKMVSDYKPSEAAPSKKTTSVELGKKVPYIYKTVKNMSADSPVPLLDYEEYLKMMEIGMAGRGNIATFLKLNQGIPTEHQISLQSFLKGDPAEMKRVMKLRIELDKKTLEQVEKLEKEKAKQKEEFEGKVWAFEHPSAINGIKNIVEETQKREKQEQEALKAISEASGK